MPGADQYHRNFQRRLRIRQYVGLELSLLARDFSFDSQARFFDRRAGLPAAASRQVAAAIVSRLALRPGDLLLELGAGTGEVGAELWRLLPRGVSYLACDLSFGMLALFGRKASRDKLAADPSKPLWRVLADLSRPWPLPEGSVAAIFSSRAAHRLEPGNLLAELRRVSRPGATLILGSLERSRHSVRRELQQEMRRLLFEILTGESGQDPGAGSGSGRDSRHRHRQLAEAFGGERENLRAASFEVFERPADSLAGWRSKPGLAGLEVSAATQQQVLDRLEGWARERYENLSTPRRAIEHYELLIAHRGSCEEKL